jgi:Concanavalin A-like lectin/glucanases superfamily
MSGIMQPLISGGENVVGYRGRSAYTNSLIFGSTAGATLAPGDTAKMSSLLLTNIPTVGTGDFTVEYWVRHSNVEFVDGIVHDFWQGIFSGNVLGALTILHTSDSVYVNNNLITVFPATLPSSSVPGQTWALEVWYHIAVVRSSGTLTVWVNGVKNARGSVTDNNNYNVQEKALGSWGSAHGAGTTNNLIGKLYNFRLLSSAVYSPSNTNITVPRLPFSNNASTNILLLGTNTGTNLLTDSSGHVQITAFAGTVLGTGSTPFNDPLALSANAKTSLSSPFTGSISGSYKFPGTSNSYGTIAANSKLAVNTGDFTIEWFSYQNDTNAASTHWWYGATASPSLGISFEGSGSTVDVKLYYSGGSITLATSLVKSTYNKLWTHWAVVRISGMIYFYKNGLLINTGGTAFSASLTDVSSTFYVGAKGASGTTADSFGGYITNLRMVNVGAYTGNFTVPTSNLLRLQTANYYGGSNTAAIRSDQSVYLMVP